MDPLSAYLLSVAKRQATTETRKFHDVKLALEELGYWMLLRPSSYTRGSMPPTNISKECLFVEEFRMYTPEMYGCTGFDSMIEVYADPKVANLTVG